MRQIMGMEVIIKQPTIIKERRTWKERLFTRPWEPLREYNIKYEDMIEDGQVIRVSDKLIMNQYTYNKLKENVNLFKKTVDNFNFLC